MDITILILFLSIIFTATLIRSSIGFGDALVAMPMLVLLLGLKSDRTAYFFGLLGGLFGGAFNTSGPFIVVYATLKEWHPSEFRTSLQGYFIASNILIISMHGATGLWTKHVMLLFLMALPIIFMATLLGGKLNHIIPKKKFDKLVCCFLIIIGSYLIFKNLLT